MGITRRLRLYPRCVNAVKNKSCKFTKKEFIFEKMNKAALQEKYKWALEVPYDVRGEGMNDVLKAIESK